VRVCVADPVVGVAVPERVEGGTRVAWFGGWNEEGRGRRVGWGAGEDILEGVFVVRSPRVEGGGRRAGEAIDGHKTQASQKFR
jgi:hypothetical protein